VHKLQPAKLSGSMRNTIDLPRKGDSTQGWRGEAAGRILRKIWCIVIV